MHPGAAVRRAAKLGRVGLAQAEPALDHLRIAKHVLPEPLHVAAINSEVLTIALGMLAGLDALHRSGVIHRDPKPSNVFLTPQGVKLLDFGVASHAGADALETATRLTTPGMMVGTPQYAAPEQLRGEPMDVRSDIFSAATVVYEMLAGRPPFSGSSPVERCHAILHEPPAIRYGGGRRGTCISDRSSKTPTTRRAGPRSDGRIGCCPSTTEEGGGG